MTNAEGRDTTADATSPAAATRCSICREIVVSGQSAHEQCGGYLPDDEREWAWACAHHIEKLLKRPKTLEQLRHRLRSEYQGDVLEMALELMTGAGKLTRQGEFRGFGAPRS
ncbi:MAG: hypothetical protein ACLP3C_00565 [Mycobacterium sp.]|uniref:hypothetical protein n=1 Tax=Mycobacterium sp. TaxID=1785 RepID=UPI003F9C604F